MWLIFISILFKYWQFSHLEMSCHGTWLLRLVIRDTVMAESDSIHSLVHWFQLAISIPKIIVDTSAKKKKKSCLKPNRYWKTTNNFTLMIPENTPSSYRTRIIFRNTIRVKFDETNGRRDPLNFIIRFCFLPKFSNSYLNSTIMFVFEYCTWPFESLNINRTLFFFPFLLY